MTPSRWWPFNKNRAEIIRLRALIMAWVTEASEYELEARTACGSTDEVMYGTATDALLKEGRRLLEKKQ